MFDEPTIVVASRSAIDIFEEHEGQLVVRTPLELIDALVANSSISTAVLVDMFAREKAFAAFLREAFPWVHLITIDWPAPDPYRTGVVPAAAAYPA